MVKRIFDTVVSAAALCVLSPLIAVVALLIEIDSAGPVFYRGVRSGKGGKPFRMLKFRTMVADAGKRTEGTTGLDDPRITRIGALLRKPKIDELPQLINVLIGEMSLVGPRPELPRYTKWYNDEEKQILSVRPGITDFSSIHFSSLGEVVGSEDVDRVFEERVLPQKNRMRLRYVRERSFFVDLKILARTALVVFEKAFGRGWGTGGGEA